MTGFVIGAAIFLLVAAALATWPLLQRRETSVAADRRATNVDLYRQRVAEIARDREAGVVSAADADAMARESAAALLDDEGSDDARSHVEVTSDGPGRWVAAVLVVAIVGLSVTLYRYLGAYDAVKLGAATQVLRDADADPAALGDFVKQLRARVATKPDDAESWFLLGHTLLRLDDAKGAVDAFEHVYALDPDDVTVQIALAQSRFAADGGAISDANRALLERILADDPRQANALEMLALDAFRRSDYQSAARYLETALSGGTAGARAAALQQGLKQARAMIGDAGPALDVTVDLGAAIRGMPATAALFVYARRPGERMPLLVARRPLDGTSITVRLDRANAMQGDVTLTPGEIVDVAARVSPSGDIMPGANDPQAHRPGVALTNGVTPIALALGPPPAVAQLPEPAMPEPNAGPATAALPTTALATTAPAAANGAAVHVSVALAPGVAVAPPARIFVIARQPNGPPMPIAVRALDPAALPQQLVLTDRDAMQPSRVLSMFDRVEVVARLSRSGNPIRQPGDLESPSQVLDPHTAATAALIIGG